MRKIPLFPLRTVLYPRGRLLLRIFEPRYLDMVSECMRTNSGFGICLIKAGAETGPPAACFDIGTYAEIIDFSQQSDGLLSITAQGRQRFRILRASKRDNNLLEGEVEWMAEGEELDCPEKYHALRDIYLYIVNNYQTPYVDESHDAVGAETLSYRLAEFLPFEPQVKQELLETGAAARRLELIEANLADAEIEFEI